MLAAIRYNLAHLTHFTGRDARQTFWYYVLFLVVIQIGVGIIASIPMYIEMIGGAVDAAKAGVPEDRMMASMMAQVAGGIRTQMLIGAGVSVITALLFVAAFVRRLHDGGFPSWIAAVPVIVVLASNALNLATLDTMLAAMRKALATGDPAQIQALQSDMAPYSLLGWIGYLVVIGFGVLKSQPGPNRYGDAPVRF